MVLLWYDFGMENELRQKINEGLLEKKKQQWEGKMAEMMKPDIYGYILDKEIRETVVVLNLLGFNTTQSDQGNYGDTPFIQFEAIPPKNYFEGEEELKISLMTKFGISVSELDEGSQLFNRKKQVEVEEGTREKLVNIGARYTPEYERWYNDTLELADKLKNIIDDFYSSVPIPKELIDLHVCVKFPYRATQYPAYIHDIPHLEVKNDIIGGLTEGKHREIVTRAQHEMKRFTEFLKEKYFLMPFK